MAQALSYAPTGSPVGLLVLLTRRAERADRAREPGILLFFGPDTTVSARAKNCSPGSGEGSRNRWNTSRRANSLPPSQTHTNSRQERHKPAGQAKRRDRTRRG